MHSNKIKYIAVLFFIIIFGFINLFIKTQNDSLLHQFKNLTCEKQSIDNLAKKIIKEDFCLENSLNFCQDTSNINETISDIVNKYCIKDLTMKLTNQTTDLFNIENIELRFSSHLEKNVYKIISDILKITQGICRFHKIIIKKNINRDVSYLVELKFSIYLLKKASILQKIRIFSKKHSKNYTNLNFFRTDKVKFKKVLCIIPFKSVFLHDRWYLPNDVFDGYKILSISNNGISFVGSDKQIVNKMIGEKIELLN